MDLHEKLRAQERRDRQFYEDARNCAPFERPSAAAEYQRTVAEGRRVLELYDQDEQRSLRRSVLVPILVLGLIVWLATVLIVGWPS